MPSNDEIKDEVLTENTAQAVFKYLNDLESNREHLSTRWIWELLQNARDAGPGDDTNLVTSIKHRQGEVVFEHNGRGFVKKEIAHLIYHGSTKVGEDSALGRFGSGFLTTHLLSPEIYISGQLDSGEEFEFLLEREPDSVQALHRSMDKSWNDFNHSLSSTKTPLPDGFTSRFMYPIDDGASDSVEDGIAALNRCAPLVVAFNRQFARIDIQVPGGTKSFQVLKRAPLTQQGLHKITVAEMQNGAQTNVKEFVLARGAKARVAVQVETTDSGCTCLAVDNTPRLFLGFPLIGTEQFSFPAVINSFQFTPTEHRDGVYLWRAENESNRRNESIFREACDLLLRLIEFAGAAGWGNTCTLAEVPDIPDKDWLTSNHLQTCLSDQFIVPVRGVAAVPCFHGPTTPEAATIPFSDNDDGVEALWDLMSGLKELQPKLPARDEAVGWRDVIKSWAAVDEGDETSFPWVLDGRKLARKVRDEAKTDADSLGRLETLQNLLRQDVCAVEWLNQLYGCLKANGFDDVVSSYKIVLDQSGYLDGLSELHRDQGIAEELKDVAELLGWNIRLYLRDVRLSPLANEIGKGDWDNDYVVQELIRKLRDRAESNPDDSFAKASVRLFAWVVEQRDLKLLRNFPVFAQGSDSRSPEPLELERVTDDVERPLAPVGAWPEDLRRFSDLFPSSHIMADDYFDAVSDQEVWRELGAEQFVNTDVILREVIDSDSDLRGASFLLVEPLAEDTDHRTTGHIEVTEVAFLSRRRVGIADRMRRSRRLACLFWDFLTQYLTKNESCNLEAKEVGCSCKEGHRYYPAAWLRPLKKNKWVPIGESSADVATAKSLANLLRDNERRTVSLRKNPGMVRFLDAIGVSRVDLMRELVSKNEEDRARMDDQLTHLMTATEGDLGNVLGFVDDLDNDDQLLDHLTERRKRRQMVNENRKLGEYVEDLVKESLEREGFIVCRTGTGSDFKIEYESSEPDDVTNLELSLADRTWLVEVKATRHSDVRMTPTQACTAVDRREEFLLCVVPVEPKDPDPDVDDVRGSMRFVPNIGSSLERLCKELDGLEGLREDIVAEGTDGVRLEVASGAARFRVSATVWSKGLQLSDLASQLKLSA